MKRATVGTRAALQPSVTLARVGEGRLLVGSPPPRAPRRSRTRQTGGARATPPVGGGGLVSVERRASPYARERPQ